MPACVNEHAFSQKIILLWQYNQKFKCWYILELLAILPERVIAAYCQKLICIQNPVLPQYCGNILRQYCGSIAAICCHKPCILVRDMDRVHLSTFAALSFPYLKKSYTFTTGLTDNQFASAQLMPVHLVR